jgi:hypothetical protein
MSCSAVRAQIGLGEEPFFMRIQGLLCKNV